jgi:hypothetical protein
MGQKTEAVKTVGKVAVKAAKATGKYLKEMTKVALKIIMFIGKNSS